MKTRITEIRKRDGRVVEFKDDLKLPLNAVEVLKRRYLLKDELGKVVETPSQMFKRVAKAIARAELNYGKSKEEVKEIERRFYLLMRNLEFLPNSPTLMNAGTELGQLAACFVLPVEDSMGSIFNAVKNTALIHQSGGGTGFSFSRLRPKGDVVKSTGGVASGPVSFMRVFDVATDVIKQGGKRRGANMGILSAEHPDILEFIRAKEGGEFANFNTSVAVTDGFMHAVERNEEYGLVNPRTKKEERKIKAREVFNEIVTYAWKTGDPGIIFIDEINRHNPVSAIGKLEATNPCVTVNTWVMTVDGPRLVEELIGKKFVAIVNGEGWESSGDGFFETGVKSVYRLKTAEGFELRLTANHPVMKVERMTRHRVETQWSNAADLKPGDKIITNNHRSFGNWSVKDKYTEGDGYLIGLLLGDGTIKKDKTILSSWGDSKGVKTVRSTAYNYAQSLPHRSDFVGWSAVKGRNEYRLSLGYLKRLAKELGLNPRVKVISKKMEKAQADFCKGLLSGLFDADGSVQGNQSKGVSIRLSQNDLEILNAVQRMLLRFGIFSKIYINRRIRRKSKLPDGKGGVKEYITKPQHELVISKENILHFAERVGFRDTEKMEKLEKAIRNYRRKMNRERFIATVKEVVPDGVEKVYDVQIPGINAFDANGFVVHNCGEQPLLPYESCNLGSINVSKFVKNGDGEIDWERLKEAVWLCVRFLDDVIDVNRYPLPEIEKMTKANRKIGLGIMGFAELLIKLGIAYDSKDAISMAEKLMQFITNEARQCSTELGLEKASFPNFELSGWSAYDAMRNATVTTIAPTGTISIIAGCSSGIEPLFAVAFIRNVMGGMLEINKLFEEIAKERGFYSKDLITGIAKCGSVQDIDGIPSDVKRVFVTALDIAPEWHVRLQAAFQKYTDNAVSKTVNLPTDATWEDVKKVFLLAYNLKCKGITVYRYGSKEQVLSLEVPKLMLEEYVCADSEYTGECRICSV
ncbi:MAG: LAGLIDADG family homing endonuclease [Halobacteriota archaeon]